jgi:hypothetical protein
VTGQGAVVLGGKEEKIFDCRKLSFYPSRSRNCRFDFHALQELQRV